MWTDPQRKANLGCSKRAGLTGRPWFYRSKTSCIRLTFKQQVLSNSSSFRYSLEKCFRVQYIELISIALDVVLIMSIKF